MDISFKDDVTVIILLSVSFMINEKKIRRAKRIQIVNYKTDAFIENRYCVGIFSDLRIARIGPNSKYGPTKYCTALTKNPEL